MSIVRAIHVNRMPFRAKVAPMRFDVSKNKRRVSAGGDYVVSLFLLSICVLLRLYMLPLYLLIPRNSPNMHFHRAAYGHELFTDRAGASRSFR